MRQTLAHESLFTTTMLHDFFVSVSGFSSKRRAGEHAAHLTIKSDPRQNFLLSKLQHNIGSKRNFKINR